MRRASSPSLRLRLMLLVALSILPALLLISSTARHERHEALLDAHDRVLRLSRLAAASEDRLVEGARHVLITLARTDELASRSPQDCSRLLASLLEDLPGYSNLGAVDGDGELWCSALPFKPMSLADRPYVKLALEGRPLAVGEWQIGRVTGKGTINLGVPLTGEGVRQRGLVYAALDLEWLARSTVDARLPPSANVLLLDRRGVILVDQPDPHWVGHAAPAEIAAAAARSTGEEVLRLVGPDGVPRLYAFTPLGSAMGQLELGVGLSERAILQESDRGLARDLGLMLLVGVLAIAAAWIGGELFVLRRVRRLVSVAQRIEAGDLSARVAAPEGGGELGQLARAFDDMAAALDVRQSERDGARAQLERDALHDRTTNLPNRALFVDRVGLAVERARRGEGRLAVLILDIDRFKVVIDGMGRMAGDEMLATVGRRLATAVRPGDTAARLGGDEFAILLDGIVDPADCEASAERTRQAIAAPFALTDGEAFVTASVGIAMAPVGAAGVTPEQLLRDAEIAMYAAKKRGGDRVENFAPGMHERAVERMHLDTGLRRALERDELRLAFQPIVALETGRIVGCEALVRWEHPQRGLILPGDFVPMAEETGLIGLLGEWVLHRTCMQARRWLEQGLRPVRVAVNVSASQIREGGLSPLVRSALDASGLPAPSLELEITESCLMDQAEATLAILRSLREVGVRLSVDDFGTGYSSMRYLRRFPLDTLKIDQEFVKAIGNQPGDAAIARAIIGLAHSLGLVALAEGVETRDQALFLHAEGCDEIQGRLFSHPIPADDFALLLAQDVRFDVTTRV